MKKKHVAVHNDLEDQKQSISSMNSEQSRLETVIKASRNKIWNVGSEENSTNKECTK